jgi:hypothetical protein
VQTKVTVYCDPYGRFSLCDRRGAYPVDVELADGYRIVEDACGRKVLVGPHESQTDLNMALLSGVARFV